MDLMKINMPMQAIANSLQLDLIPSELKDLNNLELHLISLRIPFMKLVALPSGKQCSIHGPAVNVPSKLDSVCTLLPRLPTEASMIPFKLKRKLGYKGHYMYDYVRPDKVLPALKWLKANNLLYSSIEIDDEWINNEAIVNTEFVRCGNFDNNCDDLSTTVLQCNNVQSQSSDPMKILCKNAKDGGFVIHDVPKDNNCFFRTVSYQLPNISLQSIDAKTLRAMVVDYLQGYPTVDGVHYCNFMNDDNCDVLEAWEKPLDYFSNDE